MRCNVNFPNNKYEWKMTNERKLLSAYAMSDDRGKQSILDHALSTAEDWPLVNVVIPSSPVSLPGGKLDDLEPPPLVRPPV